MRGGSFYTAVGSMWYFPNDLDKRVNTGTHNKLLLMGPSYDRHGTVGFRCVADAPGPLPPPPPQPPSGCADGSCDAFCDHADVQGCAASLAQAVSMRAPATGSPCGGVLGACAAPADACAPGWALCISDFSKASLSADGFRARMSASECASSGDGGKYIAAMSHTDCNPNQVCPTSPYTADAGCTATGWGSEALCCGADCVPAGCPDGLYPSATTIYDNQEEGCGSVRDVMTGFLCCKV